MRRALACRTIPVVLCLSLVSAACAGKEGAAGPTGPQGPAGRGASTVVLSGVADSNGGVSKAMPAAAGTNSTQPPQMDCYQTPDPSDGTWLAVASSGTSDFDTTCGVVFSNGVWYAVMINMVPGWTAAFVVSY